MVDQFPAGQPPSQPRTDMAAVAVGSGVINQAAGDQTFVNLGSLIVFASAAVGVGLSVFTAVNLLTGSYSQISLVAAIVCVGSAIVLAIVGPILLRRATKDIAGVRPAVLRLLSWVLAVVLAASGVVPFVTKLALARAAKSDGLEYFDRNYYAAAVGPLERAARYFDDIGLPGEANSVKVALVETYAGLRSWAQAVELIDEIESSIPSDEVRGRLLGVRAGIQYGLGHHEEAELLYQQARQLTPPNSKTYATLLMNQAQSWVSRGGRFADRARAQLDEARRIYEHVGDELGVAYVLAGQGDLEQRPSDGRRLLQEALQIAERHEDHGLAGSLLTRIAAGHRIEGDYDLARRAYNEALGRFERVADALGHALVHSNLATLEQAAGQQAAAAKQIEMSEAFVRVIKTDDHAVQPRFIADLRTRQGDVYDALGEDKASEAHYREALDLYARNPEPLAEAHTLVNYSALLLRLGRIEEARSLLSRVREIVDAFGGDEPTTLLGVLEANLGRIDDETGDLLGAGRHNKKAWDIFDATGDRIEQARTMESIAVIGIRVGVPAPETLAILNKALEIYRDVNNRDFEVNTRYVIYNLLDSDTDRQAAVRDILDLLDRHDIDYAIQTPILLDILPQDVGDLAQLRAFRERLHQLNTALAGRDSKSELGLSFLQLARVCQNLGDRQAAVRYAREAEPLAGAISAHRRPTFHWELGRVLVDAGIPADGLEHFWEAYRLLAGRHDALQLGQLYLQRIEQTIGANRDIIDLGRQLVQARDALRLATEPQELEVLTRLTADLERRVGP